MSQHRDTESSFYQFDALGSTRALTDDSQTVTDSAFYQAFGQAFAPTGTTENPFGWVGELGYYLDAETGQQSLRQRQYETGIGRFASQDPLDNESNSYRYAGNRPVAYVDPSGAEGQPQPRIYQPFGGEPGWVPPPPAPNQPIECGMPSRASLLCPRPGPQPVYADEESLSLFAEFARCTLQEWALAVQCDPFHKQLACGGTPSIDPHAMLYDFVSKPKREQQRLTEDACLRLEQRQKQASGEQCCVRAPTAEEQRWIDFQNTWEGADLSNPANAAALSVQYQRLCGNPDCASAISLQFLLLYGLGPFTGGPFRPNAPTIPRPPRQTISLPKDYYPPVEPCQPESPCPPTPPAAPPAGRPAPQGPTVLPASPPESPHRKGGDSQRGSPQRGVGGRGWRGDKNWRDLVNLIRKGGTIEANPLPTKSEGIDLIAEAGGRTVRIEKGHRPPNPHQYPHINYLTSSGVRGTLRIISCEE